MLTQCEYFELRNRNGNRSVRRYSFIGLTKPLALPLFARVHTRWINPVSTGGFFVNALPLLMIQRLIKIQYQHQT
jgi:hypothetical protein